MLTHAQVRSGTDAEWHDLNPVVADGDLAFVKDLGKYKIGDGVTRFHDLEFAGGEDGPALPDWILDPAPADAAFGIQTNEHRVLIATKSDGLGVVYVTDVEAAENSGNGILWNSGSSDGAADQGMAVYAGADGAHTLEFKGDGVLKVDGEPVGSPSVQAGCFVRWEDEDGSPATVGSEPTTLTKANLGGTSSAAIPADNALVDALATDGTLTLPPGEYHVRMYSDVTLNAPAPGDGSLASMNLVTLTGGAFPLLRPGMALGDPPMPFYQDFEGSYTYPVATVDASIAEGESEGEPETWARFLVVETSTFAFQISGGDGSAQYHLVELLKIA